jgi:hypothetical protein
MRITYRTLALTLSALALALLVVPNSTAECGVWRLQATPSSWHFQPEQAQLLQAALVTINDQETSEAGIVGFWHFKFMSKGSAGIPDGTEVDAGYAQWHSDGTEITNSGGRAPSTGNFCLGVWKKVGERKYRLNHFAISWDSTGSHLIGPARIQEVVTLEPKGNKFTGVFMADQFDEVGNKLGHVQGIITGSRIGVDTPEQSVF